MNTWERIVVRLPKIQKAALFKMADDAGYEKKRGEYIRGILTGHMRNRPLKDSGAVGGTVGGTARSTTV